MTVRRFIVWVAVICVWLGQAPRFAHAESIREFRLGVALSKSVQADQGWKEQFKRRLAYASKIFEREAAIRFKPVIFWNWEPRDESRDMTFLMEDLRSTYPLNEVDIIVGVTSLHEMPAPEQLNDLHVIGRAGAFSGYLVLREPVRKLLHVQRETVLVHELGHLFGAVHVNDPESIMSPVVERQIPARLDAANRKIISLSRNVDFRKGEGSLDRDTIRRLLLSYRNFAQYKQAYDFYYALGSFYVKLGEYDGALEAWTEASRMEPDNPQIHYDLGVLYSRMGNASRSVRSLSKAVAGFHLPSQDAYKASALNLLGAAYFQSGDLDGAYRAWKRSLALRPGSLDVEVNLGAVEMKRGRLDEALGVFNKALNEGGGDVRVYSNLGSVYAQKGEYDKAIHFLNRALEKVPEQSRRGKVSVFDMAQPSEIYTNLGFVYMKRGDQGEALKYFKAACDLNPSVSCRQRVGEMYFRLGYWDGAIQEMLKVLKDKRDDPQVFGVLGVAFFRKGDLKRSKEMFQEGLKYAKDKKSAAALHANIGDLYRQAREFNSAAREYKFAIAKDWNHVDAHLGLAHIYLVQEMRSEAAASLKRILVIDPNHKRAKQLLSQIESDSKIVL